MSEVTVSRDDLVALLDYAQPAEEEDVELTFGGETPDNHILNEIRRLRGEVER